MHTEAAGTSSDVTSILEATTTLDVPFASPTSATTSRATANPTPIHSPTIISILSFTSSPIPTPNTTPDNTQDATADTDIASTPHTSPTPGTTPDPTQGHGAVLTTRPKATTSPDTTTDMVTPQSTLSPILPGATPDSTGVLAGAVGGVVGAAVLLGLLVLVISICFIFLGRYVSYYRFPRRHFEKRVLCYQLKITNVPTKWETRREEQSSLTIWHPVLSEWLWSVVQDFLVSLHPNYDRSITPAQSATNPKDWSTK